MTGPWRHRQGARGAARVGWFGGEGPAALELALAVPIALLVYLGSLEASRAMAAYRKLSDLTAQLADVASQETGGYARRDIDAINAASAQIMAPFPSGGLAVATTEVTTDARAGSGRGTVVWSRGLADGVASSPRRKGERLTALPTGLAPHTSYILVQTSYDDPPAAGGRFIPPLPTLKTEIISPPRAKALIPCSDCD